MNCQRLLQRINLFGEEETKTKQLPSVAVVGPAFGWVRRSAIRQGRRPIAGGEIKWRKKTVSGASLVI